MQLPDCEIEVATEITKKKIISLAVGLLVQDNPLHYCHQTAMIAQNYIKCPKKTICTPQPKTIEEISNRFAASAKSLPRDVTSNLDDPVEPRRRSGVKIKMEKHVVRYTEDSVDISVVEIMKREADAGAMTGSGGPTSPHKRYRQGDDELRLLIPSKYPCAWIILTRVLCRTVLPRNENVNIVHSREIEQIEYLRSSVVQKLSEAHKIKLPYSSYSSQKLLIAEQTKLDQ
ncbi:hypothetical protein WN51_00650 [Melipona quadrifasciata]|uniref:Uncharacterized protein n=1 Tax=Melipona quadrifasciata TaxID=166423 RepID=A0A0M9A186_9HYME|nr:hypothetical protein WN51_00650 [Melipona quadrifasciata]